ncbi:MAG: hypothetical protein KKE44_10530 [Proteobacteria bacterium]|nr:hypothetical protein [Pseudomonadota bacterium]MBU1583160.1 hypothetical protein [Pseudomonadota bacterium]MBU2431923.1 hypothetical protein [Pseudomonadota bacterium]MBU2452937.1 hypothetical protein [Pseudomonadota bacterium]MBU2627527.1 hypothetical protein [Pseudomonadota bacterium]
MMSMIMACVWNMNIARKGGIEKMVFMMMGMKMYRESQALENKVESD